MSFRVFRGFSLLFPGFPDDGVPVPSRPRPWVRDLEFPAVDDGSNDHGDANEPERPVVQNVQNVQHGEYPY